MYRFVSLLLFSLLFLTACSVLSSGPVTPAYTGMQGMLAAHNQVRAQHGLARLSWSTELSAYSQDWANHLAGRNRCRMQHRSEAGKDFKQYGENLFWGSPTRWSDGRTEVQNIDGARVALDWASERPYYDYNSNSCQPGQQCGHYTQMVWRDTTQVGCAMTLCPDLGQIWVCSYNPPGNWRGQRPY